MELRGNIKRIGNGENGLTVNEPKKTIIHNPNKIIDAQIPQTKAEKAKGILSDLAKGFQGFADWAGSTRAGSGQYNEIYGSTPIMNMREPDMFGEQTIQKKSRKRRQ